MASAQSLQKNYFLPEAHTDFILAIIGEELGAVGVLGVLTLYGMLAYAGLRVAKRAVGRYAKLVAAGITSMIMCQAALNVFAVLGLAPLTGRPVAVHLLWIEQPRRAAGRDGRDAQHRLHAREAAPSRDRIPRQ